MKIQNRIQYIYFYDFHIKYCHLHNSKTAFCIISVFCKSSKTFFSGISTEVCWAIKIAHHALQIKYCGSKEIKKDNFTKLSIVFFENSLKQHVASEFHFQKLQFFRPFNIPFFIK